MPGDLSALGDLVLEVGGDLSPLKKSLDEIPDVARKAGAELEAALGMTATQGIDNLGAAVTGVKPKLEELGQAANNVNKQTTELTLSWKSLLDAFAKIEILNLTIHALKEAIGSAVETAAAIEKTTIELTRLTGSVEAANLQIGQLKTLALSNALSFPSLIEANQKVMALGFSASQARLSLQAAADAAASTGKSFDQITSSMDRIAQSGQLAARQLQVMGLNTQDIAKAMNMAGASTRELSDAFKSLDPGDRLNLLIGALSKYSGAAHDMAASLTKEFQNLKTEMTLALSGIGESLTPMLKDLVGTAQGSLVPALESLVKAFKDVGQAVGPLISGVLTTALEAVGDAATIAGATISTMVAPLNAIGIATKEADFSWKSFKQALLDNTPLSILHAIAVEIQLAAGSIKLMASYSDLLKVRFSDATEKMRADIEKLTGKSGLLGIRLEMEAQNDALVAAKKNLADVTAAFQQHMATSGQVKAAQDEVNKALYAMDPAAKAAADAAKRAASEIATFGKSIQALFDRIPQTYEAYLAKLSDGGQKASASVATIERDIDRALELMGRGASAAAVHLQQLYDTLAKAKAFADNDAFYKLSQEIDKIVGKYPEQIDKLDESTKLWIATMQEAADKIPAALNKITDAQALKDFAESQKALDDSTKKLGETFTKAYDAMFKKGTEQINVQHGLRTEVDQTTNAVFAMSQGMSKFGILTQGYMDSSIKAMRNLLALMEQFNQPLAMRLQLQEKILSAQIQEAAAIGASGDATLKLTQAWEAVRIKEEAVHNATMALSNLYLDMTKAFSEAWHAVSTGIADAIVSGQNFGQVFTQVLDTLKKQLAELVVDYLMTKVKDAILTNTGLLEGFNKVFNNIFGGGAGGGGAIDVLKQAQENAAGAAKAISETFASASDGIKQVQSSAGQAISSVTTSAVSAIGSMVSMVTGIITAITGIIEVFQLSHMNKLLGRIEESTRKTWIVTGEQADSIQYNTKWMSLNVNDLKGWIIGPQFDALNNISSSLDAINYNTEKMMWDLRALAQSGSGGGGSAGGGTMGSSLVDAMLEQIKKLQGALTILDTGITGPYGLGPVVTGLAGAADGLSNSFSDLSGAASSLNDSLATTAAAAGAGASSSTFSPNVPAFRALPGGGPAPSMGAVEIHTTLYAGVVAGSNGMQQLSDMVGDKIITKLRQVAGLKV